jgi:hypothetical protein
VRDHFVFDCPSCARRLGIRAAQQGEVLKCAACWVQFPAPTYEVPRARPAPHIHRQYLVQCPVCDQSRAADESRVGHIWTCRRCGHESLQPLPDWEQWRRPVARVLSAGDLRFSLQYALIHLVREPSWQHTAGAGESRRFEFYCGACGALQTSSVWHIARQGRCRVCNAFIIIPAPRVRAGRTRPAWRLVRSAPLPGSRGLYCPACGGHIAEADRTRHCAAFCATCQRWF